MSIDILISHELPFSALPKRTLFYVIYMHIYYHKNTILFLLL